MTIRSRLNLVLCVMMLLAIVVVGVFSYVVAQRRVVGEGKAMAQFQLATGQAVRRYTVEHVREAILADGAFHSGGIPSFAANTAMRYLQEAYPDYAYREVASNPTNPANRSKGWEEDAIRQFRHSGAANQEFFLHEGAGLNERILLAKPLVATAACLQCHGRVDQAPPAMVQRYGKDFGFGWSSGDIIGAQVVTVSLRQARRDAAVASASAMGMAAMVCGLFFLGLKIALRRVVLSPIQESFKNYRRMAATDALTDLANRREFMERMDSAVRRAERNDRDLAVIVIDIDHFKRLNDTFGHAAGDDVLRELGQCLSQGSKRRDLPARLGGEEFAILLPGSQLRHARRFAAALCRTIATTRFSHVGQVTASLGVAQRQPGESAAAVLKRADDALYAAKQAGRNCVRAAE